MEAKMIKKLKKIIVKNKKNIKKTSNGHNGFEVEHYGLFGSNSLKKLKKKSLQA